MLFCLSCCIFDIFGCYVACHVEYLTYLDMCLMCADEIFFLSRCRNWLINFYDIMYACYLGSMVSGGRLVLFSSGERVCLAGYYRCSNVEYYAYCY